MMDRPARPSDVDEICAALPETELGISWGDRPTWKVPRGAKGKGFLLYRAPHNSAVDPDTGRLYEDLLVIRVSDPGAKQALVDDDGPFFTIDHFKNYNAVLIQQSRLDEIGREEFAEIITEAWACMAPKRLVKTYFAES